MFSAPQITPEQQREEWEHMSQEERQRIHDDIFGRTLFEETSEMIETGPASLEAALTQIPKEQKSAYLQALDRCPDVIESETDPIAFLRSEDYNAEDAAWRVVRYWRRRVKLFGERAFLPMTIAGAMAEDADWLHEAGCIQYPTGYDNHGRLVIYINRSGFKGESRDSVLRACFYLLHVAIAGEEQAQKNGVVAVMNFKFFDLYKNFDRIFTRTMLEMFYEIPMKLKANHILFASSGRTIMDVIAPVFYYLAGRYTRLRSKHHGGLDAELAERMASFGIPRDSLHTNVGGTFTDEDYLDWLRSQELKEKDLFAEMQQRYTKSTSSDEKVTKKLDYE